MAIMLISLAGATTFFKRNAPINLVHPVRLDEFPNSNVNCNLTVFNPENVIIVDYQEMTNSFEYHNYTIPSNDTPTLGTYTYDITCTTGSANRTESFSFVINGSGEEVTTGQGLIYVAVLFVSIFIFIILIILSIKIPWKHGRSGEGNIVSINDFRYFKIFTIGLSYISLLWIMFIMRNLTLSFLYSEFTYTFFSYFYWILLAGLLPTWVIFIFFTIIIFLENSKLREQLERNFTVR